LRELDERICLVIYRVMVVIGKVKSKVDPRRLAEVPSYLGVNCKLRGCIKVIDVCCIADNKVVVSISVPFGMRKDINFSKINFFAIHYRIKSDNLHPNDDCILLIDAARMLFPKVFGNFV
jgi:hypothetical protein